VDDKQLEPDIHRLNSLSFNRAVIYFSSNDPTVVLSKPVEASLKHTPALFSRKQDSNEVT